MTTEVRRIQPTTRASWDALDALIPGGCESSPGPVAWPPVPSSGCPAREGNRGAAPGPGGQREAGGLAAQRPCPCSRTKRAAHPAALALGRKDGPREFSGRVSDQHTVFQKSHFSCYPFQSRRCILKSIPILPFLTDLCWSRCLNHECMGLLPHCFFVSILQNCYNSLTLGLIPKCVGVLLSHNLTGGLLAKSVF